MQISHQRQALTNTDAKIQKGSVISSINAQSVILSSYETTTQLLSRWQPPLVLGFRVVPPKEGSMIGMKRRGI